jgi:uncharacterized repeat protein (TIGR01451 family)
MKFLLFFLTASLVATQPVYAQTAEFEVTQQVRNLTQQDFSWENIAQAKAGDRLEMRITVRWTGNAPTQNVLARETLDQKLTYEGNLKLDGAAFAGNISTENLNLGTFEAGGTKTLTFEVTVQGPESFSAGTAVLINSSTVFNTESAKSVVSTVHVGRDGVPTDVSTGPLTLWMIAGFLAAVAVLLAGFVLFTKQYFKTQVLESEFNTKTERKLADTIGNIRKKEKRG